MMKKQRSEAENDSDELQALFDSIATAPAVKSDPPARVEAKAAVLTGEVGDSNELQDLFDSVAAEFTDGETEQASTESESALENLVESATGEAVFNRIGVMTRQVHDTLTALGADGSSSLHQAVLAMPDARQRLNYITQMTEQAASRVLNATDIAKPLQDKVCADADALAEKWDRLFANQLSVDDFKMLAQETRQFMSRVGESSRATNAQLLEIMMAQDFQDLTGQVIKKVVDLAQTLETELLGVLLEVTPPDKRSPKLEGLMNGPVINAAGRDDVVTTQHEVDDLLDSLGF